MLQFTSQNEQNQSWRKFMLHLNAFFAGFCMKETAMI